MARAGTSTLDGFLVTGAGGMIGSALPSGIKATQAEVDVTSSESIRAAIKKHSPIGILHLAAMDIRQCEANPLQGLYTNVVGTRLLAEQAREHNLRLAFLSSGAVFAGQAGASHSETATPNPVNIFGMSKYLAELLLTEIIPARKLLIVRTGWVFGGHGAHHKKFVDVAIERARRHEPITASQDFTGSWTSIHDLIETLTHLIEEKTYGLFHVVNTEPGTGLDMANEIVTALGSRSKVEAVSAKDVPDAGPPRGRSEVLVSQKITLRPWRQALRSYISAHAKA